MELPVSVLTYCRQKKIEVADEGDGYVEFRAPDGMAFSTEARTRIIDITHIRASELLGLVRVGSA